MSARRTFWHLEGKRRVPTDYEIKSSRLLYYPERGLAVKTPVGAWIERYQAGSPLDLGSLAHFRDPRQTTYSTYVALEREREAFIDGLLRAADETGYDANLSSAWLESLDGWLGVLLYPCHGLQMVSAYVAHLAPVSEVVIALAFQTGDEIRRVQRLAHRVAMLRKTRPGFAARSRELWQDAPEWQPLRRVIEELLITYDFGEVAVRLLLVVKPLFDAFFLQRGARLAESHQDPLLSRLLFSLHEDCRWHEAVADELFRGVVAQSADNARLVSDWVRAAETSMRAALDALEPLSYATPEPYANALDALGVPLAKRWRALGLELGASA